MKKINTVSGGFWTFVCFLFPPLFFPLPVFSVLSPRVLVLYFSFPRGKALLESYLWGSGGYWHETRPVKNGNPGGPAN